MTTIRIALSVIAVPKGPLERTLAAVNCASPGSAITSAVVRSDATLLGYQPYGQPGLRVYDIDPAAATGLIAERFRPNSYA